MARKFTRVVRAAEMLGAAAAIAILAILFLPRLSGGNAAPPVIEQPEFGRCRERPDDVVARRADEPVHAGTGAGERRCHQFGG